MTRREYLQRTTSLTAGMTTEQDIGISVNDAPPDDEQFDAHEITLVHRMFRREFALAPGLVRNVRGGHTNRARTVAAHLRLIVTLLHHHHFLEERYIWPLLEGRIPVVSASHLPWAATQHHWIDVMLSEVRREAPIWGWNATVGSRDRLADLLERMMKTLVVHLDYEEKYIVPLMEAHLLAAEWNRSVQDAVAGMDTASTVLGLGMMMYEGDPELVETAIAHMPRELHVNPHQKAATVFAEHAQLVYGTATPPLSTEVKA